MKFADDMDDIFDELKDLSVLQRHTLKQRYRLLMKEYRQRCILYSALFYSFRLIMTVGSLTVPAMLSIQQTTGSSNVYWLTWSISLAVTTANGITTLFRLDKQFFTLHATAERLRSETWQYIQLSGRYSGHHGHHDPTHENQFVFYCSQLEKINMKRVNEEYVKANEENHTPPPAADGGKPKPNQKPTSDTLVPSPPDDASDATPRNRKDSGSTIENDKHQKETGATSTDTEKETDTIVLQVSGLDQSPVSANPVKGFTILQKSSSV